MAKKTEKASFNKNFITKYQTLFITKYQTLFILTGLSILLILESVVLIFWANRARKTSQSEIKMAVLKLEPKEGSYKVGEEFEVKIVLDTGDYETDATDVRLTFNPQVLMVTKITPGTIYDDYPAKKVDEEREVIVIYGITSLTKTFKGKDTFATITFKGLRSGQANLIFEFTPSSTTDSNVVATGIAKDVLEEVEGASIEIKSD